MKKEFLLAHEIAELFRVSLSSVYRWLRHRRDGKGNFPLPLPSPGGGRGTHRWSAEEIAQYIRSHSNSSHPVTSTIVTESRGERKAFEQRQQDAMRRLESHRANRRREKID